MLKVIRRDSHMCQICGGNVRDDEVAFDHVIPHSRGGPMTVENLRLVHRTCNQRKRDHLDEILWEPDRREVPPGAVRTTEHGKDR
jgi:5-methylcytosine-specific restriction endonuclease McrA